MVIMKRLPMLLFAAGLAIKGLLVLAWRFSHEPFLSNLLIQYDPGAFAFAERAVELLFDRRGIAPTPSEAIAFEMFLILGFGLECALVGFFYESLFRQKRGGI